jgi:murein L,D-transpeptidase YcbB/YkuD
MAALAALALLLPAPARAGAVENAIRDRIRRLGEQHAPAIGATPIAATSLLPEVYERRGFRPAWERPDRLDTLMSAIEEARADGLDPRDYSLDDLRRRRADLEQSGASDDVGARADLDLLATDALLRLAFHLDFGKVDPVKLDSHWNFTRPLDRQEAVGLMARTLDSGRIRALLDGARPGHPLYRSLRRALADHLELARRGGWPKVPSGPKLEPGAVDARVPALRARLAASGDFEGSRFGVTGNAAGDTSRLFDPRLARAVEAFQRRHLLTADGTVGPATLAALNVPIERRIDQIRVNLERGRWILHHLPDSFVVTNVAAFETYLIVGSHRVWAARCQVGQQGRQTPIFRADMRYLVFNPTWTVPPGILGRDILPHLKRGDLEVLRRKRLDVLDARGRVVSPESVDWSKVSASRCPYSFRQDAGPDNALGRVKLMFPNPHSVYLHDTPARDLFEETNRAFSSGCIRVEHPLELAERVLADPKWNAAAIARVVESGKTTTVSLRHPLPVLLLYWTAYPVPAGGEVAFAKDIYDRDGRILRALDSPVARGAGRTAASNSP